MDKALQLTSLESIVAYFFVATAIITLVLTLWAYVYQKKREKLTNIEFQSSDHGEFFIRR